MVWLAWGSSTTLRMTLSEGFPVGLRSLRAAEPFQRLRNLLCPPCYLVIAQRALAGLKLDSHQNRVLARAHSFATEDFHRNETTQLADAQLANALVNFLELHAIIKREREVALNGREARQRFITHLAQIVFVEPVEIDLSDKNILPQFAQRGDLRMNLSKLGNGSAIQHGASGAPGMIVVGRVRIVIERPMAERGEQAFDIALQVKERERTRRRTRSQPAH